MHTLHHVWMKTYLQMKRLVSAQAMPLGLSPGQPKILEYLAEYGEHEQKDIATYREIEPATVGSILLRMETAGLIARRNRPDNRRSLYVSLTPKGFTTLSMGNWIIIIFSLYIVLQFVLQGKNFQPWRILQLICTTLFGYFTDFTNLLAEMFLPDPALMTFAPAVVYGVRLLYLFISMALIALGILLYLAPDLLSLPGEGIMQVMAAKFHQPLPVVKMCFDCTISIIALILSLVYFRQFHGIREGTIIAAFGVGRILSLYEPLSRPCIAFCAARKRCNPAPAKKKGLVSNAPPMPLRRP